MLETFTTIIDNFTKNSLNQPGLAFPAYVLAGLLGSLFPCVYPLIPISAGILQKRARPGEKKYKHPLLYWLGTILAYSAMGMFAAAGGGSFNKIMQNGLVITGFGFLFLFLGFVMIDWYTFSWQKAEELRDKVKGKNTAATTVLLGMLAGLVASACVAPALVAMLVFLARNAAEHGISIGSVLYGGLLSGGFGIGIGVPFFLAGVLGSRLPSAGAWMNVVKYIFAAAIFAAAFYQLDKGFATLGFKTVEIETIFIGIILIAAAAVLGLRPPDTEVTQKRKILTKFIFALIFLALGFAAVIRGVNGSNHAENGRSGSTQPLPPEIKGNLTFYRDVPAALQAARDTKRPVFIDFYADWCANCVEFGKLAVQNAELNRALQKAVLIKIYDTDPIFLEYQSNPDYPELTIGLPFFLVLSPDNAFIWKGSNYLDTRSMIAAIEGK